MNPLAQLKETTAFCLIVFALACFAFSPGAQALKPAPDGGYSNDNTAEGDNALLSLTTGEANTAVGFDALASNTTGTSNTASGAGSLVFNTTGSANTADGFRALKYNTANFNTAVGFETLFFNTTGAQNTATGAVALENNTTGSNNTADGFQALLLNTTGTQNSATGGSALKSNTTASNNTADGFQALSHNTTGANNTAIGYNALLNNNGSSNIAVGSSAGANLTSGNNNNIDIGNGGVQGESNTIRIGSAQLRTFVKGISGAAVSGATVVINAGGQLGVSASSARFKDKIKPMDKASEAILALKPVTFRYKKELDPERIPQFGLVAEDVEKVNPDLVARDDQGKLYTVRYEAVNAMLLNEFLKEHRTVQELKSTVAEQQKQIKALASGLEKVSAQLELNKPAPRTVLNNN
jgi:endosialidase-like protein